MKNYEEMKKEVIINTVSILIDLENKGYIYGWQIRRDLNTWSATYFYKGNSYIISGDLMETDEVTILDEFERVKLEYEDEIIDNDTIKEFVNNYLNENLN